MAKSVAFSFGRFNPPTVGHEKLMDNTKRANRNYRIYASQTQDAKRNPLSHRMKVSVMKAMMPAHAKSIRRDKVTTALDAMVQLYKEKHTDVMMVVGSDRVKEFDKLLKQYNGKKAKHGFYKFKSIRVVSAGARDPDAEGVSGMSASKMRAAVTKNDYKSFEKGLPPKFKGGKKLFKLLQKEMGVKRLKEWTEAKEVPVKFHKKKLTAKNKPTPADQIIPPDRSPRIEGFKDVVANKKDEATTEGFFDFFFSKELDSAKKAIYQREYQAAARMYQQFRKRGDAAGVALHKAASTFKHVSDRGLQQFLKR